MCQQLKNLHYSKSFYFKDKKIKPINKSTFMMRTQDLKTTFYDAGQIYVFKAKNFLNNENSFNSNTSFIELDEFKSVDIDNIEDLKNAKKFLN